MCLPQGMQDRANVNNVGRAANEDDCEVLSRELADQDRAQADRRQGQMEADIAAATAASVVLSELFSAPTAEGLLNL